MVDVKLTPEAIAALEEIALQKVITAEAFWHFSPSRSGERQVIRWSYLSADHPPIEAGARRDAHGENPVTLQEASRG